MEWRLSKAARVARVQAALTLFEGIVARLPDDECTPADMTRLSNLKQRVRELIDDAQVRAIDAALARAKRDGHGATNSQPAADRAA